MMSLTLKDLPLLLLLGVTRQGLQLPLAAGPAQLRFSAQLRQLALRVPDLLRSSSSLNLDTYNIQVIIFHIHI